MKLPLVCSGSSWILKTQQQSDLFSPTTPRWCCILLDAVDIFSCSRDCSKETHLTLWLATHKHERTRIHAHAEYVLCFIEEPTFNYSLGLPLSPFNLNGDPGPQRSIYPVCIMLSARLSIYHNWLVSVVEPNHWKVERSWGRVTSLIIPGEPPNGWQGEWQSSTQPTRFRCWTWQR